MENTRGGLLVLVVVVCVFFGQNGRAGKAGVTFAAWQGEFSAASLKGTWSREGWAIGL